MTGCRIYHHFLFLFPSCSFLTICFCCQLCIHNHIHFVYILYSLTPASRFLLWYHPKNVKHCLWICAEMIFSISKWRLKEHTINLTFFQPKTNISILSLYFVLWLFTFPLIMYSLDPPGWLAWLPPGWCFRFKADSSSSQEFTNLPGFSPRIE